MKNQKLKEFFEDLIKDPENMGELNSIIENSMKMFQEIGDDIQSATKDDLKKIEENLREIETNINAKIDSLCTKHDVSRKDLENAFKDKSNFSEEEWKMLEGFQNQMKSALNTSGVPTEEVIKVDKEAKNKIKNINNKNGWISA